MSTLLRNILRSFPVQLLLLHFRKHITLLVLWAVLVAMMYGAVGKGLGFQYLFLDPEYLGEVSFFSFLIMGFAFGFFAMSWNLSSYLLTARYFSFLASLSRPFLKFCINNILLPLTVLIIYLVLLFRFNAPAGNWSQLFISWGGLLSGLVLSLLAYMLYFYLTNRDIYYYTGRRPTAPNQRVTHPFARQEGLRLNAVGRRENPYKVRYYWDNKLRNRLVRSVAHYDQSTLDSVYRQNHWNALFLQFASVLLLVVLGLLIDYKWFQFPAGSSILVLFSVITFFLGVINYWFPEWRLVIIAGLLLVTNFATSLVNLQRSNYAYGIDYNQPEQDYTEARLQQLATAETVTQDSLTTIEMLDNWRSRQADSCAKMVLLCSSGGGLSAAYWSTLVIQELEAATDRKLFKSTVLMSGASGGVMGMAYMRELQRRYVEGESFDPLDKVHRRHISADLLNPIAFSIVSNDIFLPFTEVEIGNNRYLRDRAYSFEQKYNDNTGGLLDKPISAYREAEIRGIIPQMILTPTIVNDGRLLAISALGQSHMMNSPLGRRADSRLNPDLVDLASLLGNQQRDSLRFLTALRMNATYPYVLPLVHLPTKPTMRVMDAGLRDNYGVLTAARFVQNFSEWIKANTCEVVLVQISAFKGKQEAPEKRVGFLKGLFEPLSVTGNVFSVQSFEQDNTLSYLYDLLGPDHFHLLRFNYNPRLENEQRASISFHLTEVGRQDLEASWDEEEKEKADELARLLSRQ